MVRKSYGMRGRCCWGDDSKSRRIRLCFLRCHNDHDDHYQPNLLVYFGLLYGLVPLQFSEKFKAGLPDSLSGDNRPGRHHFSSHGAKPMGRFFFGASGVISS